MRDPHHVDVLIVGAGLSGIGAAHWLQMLAPDRSWTILEGRDDAGGTWDLFRYPGVRSDSDMHTLGYGFKPWTKAKVLADGPSILAYVRQTADEFGISEHIQFGHRVERAEWDGETGRWTLHSCVSGHDHPVVHTCGFLFMCSGYYSYEGGHRPAFPGEERFRGPIVHPQDWPEDLDHTGKRVVVLGSGATAVSLVPALAGESKHVTMLQRTPTWMVSTPSVDRIAEGLRAVLPERLAYAATRRKNSWRAEFFYNLTRSRPDEVRSRLLDRARDALGDEEVATNFTPDYDPWDQRMCFMPDGDLFAAIKSGDAGVVTDNIEAFTETGIQLSSGAHLEADIVVSATGLQMTTVGDMDVVVDGMPVDFAQTWTYRGVAFSGVPNLVSTFGYVNASWTLRADLIAQFVCRLLHHLSNTGTDVVTPLLRPSDRYMTPRPFIEDFSPGYMARMMPRLPKQGDREPWTNPQRHSVDRKALKKAPLDDGALVFSRTATGRAGNV